MRPSGRRRGRDRPVAETHAAPDLAAIPAADALARPDAGPCPKTKAPALLLLQAQADLARFLAERKPRATAGGSAGQNFLLWVIPEMMATARGQPNLLVGLQDWSAGPDLPQPLPDCPPNGSGLPDRRLARRPRD